VFGAGYTTILATTDRRYRPTTGYPGDAILYASHDTPSASHSSATQRISLTDEGGGTYKIYLKCNASTILMKSDNTITVSNGSGSVVINADGSVNVVAGGSGFNITGQLNVSGVATFNSNVTVSGTLTT
jgi:phage gp45-like